MFFLQVNTEASEPIVGVVGMGAELPPALSAQGDGGRAEKSWLSDLSRCFLKNEQNSVCHFKKMVGLLLLMIA